jgi:hypothetical protein
MGDVIQLPDRVVRPRVVPKLVEAGYLKSGQRHDPDGVRNALELRTRPIDVFGRPEEDNDPTPAA